MITINEDECRDQLVELKEATEQAIDALDSTDCIGHEASERLKITALDLLLDWAKAPANTYRYVGIKWPQTPPTEEMIEDIVIKRPFDEL